MQELLIAFTKMEKKLKVLLHQKITSITRNIIEYANTPELWINLKFEKKIYPKNSFLISEGEICDKIFFIIKGGVRCFIYDSNQNDVTTWFAFENQPVILPLSYSLQLPTSELIQALEETTVWVLKQEDLEKAYAVNLQANQSGRELMEVTMGCMVLRSYSLQCEFAEERYENLLDYQPDILQRVPLKHIATFIGVKLETLSRIRRNFKIRQYSK